jgi:hypothetical protein
MLRRRLTISLILVTGTRRSRASLLMLSPSGVIRSSRRTSPGCTGGSRRLFAIHALPVLVIVHDLHIVSVPVVPDDADTILIVDPNAVLSTPIACERFEPVAGECHKITEVVGRM